MSVAFQYTATDRLGEVTKGVIHATDVDDARRRLTAAGMQVKKVVASRPSILQMGKKATKKDLPQFTYQLSVLLEARIPIAEGIRSIAEQESNPAFGEILMDIAQRIEGGDSVTDAIANYRSLFGDIYIEMVRAAEVSGNMTLILSRLAEMLERQAAINKNLMGAMLYPVCVAISIVLATAALLIWVVPRFTAMFEKKGLDLPWVTELLIFMSNTCRDWWWLIIGSVVAIVLTVRAAWRNREWQRRIDTGLHRVPKLRDLLVSVATGRFSQVLGISLQSGLGLLEALEMAGSASGRPLLERETEKLRTQVNNGGRLSEVMLSCKYLPPFARRMISAGEEAGELPRMLAIVSRHHDRETEHLTKALTTMVEPILIACLAGIVLIVALGIFLPMWNMSSMVG